MSASVRRANEAGMKELAPDLPALVPSGSNRLNLHLVSSSDLGGLTRAMVYDLYDENMADISANTSVIYTRASKKAELFHPDSRFLILTSAALPPASDDTPTMPGSLPPRSKGKGKAADFELKEGELWGFCSFRFDMEETLEGDDVEVVYCYELQLSPQARGKGLGALLMRRLEELGKQKGMRRAMLTCLKKNAAALAFYTKQGYTPDEIDPTRIADAEEWQEVDSQGEVQTTEEVDYLILSKNLSER